MHFENAIPCDRKLAAEVVELLELPQAASMGAAASSRSAG
jgi:hypothetical protein